MIWKMIRKLCPWMDPDRGNGAAAQHAALTADRQLREARRRWPQAQQAHDLLAEWIDAALRGQR